jgi:hypothetical protein
MYSQALGLSAVIGPDLSNPNFLGAVIGLDLSNPNLTHASRITRTRSDIIVS